MASALFGYGYWMVARAPVANRGVVVLGLIGKLMVVGIVYAHYFLLGDLNINLAALVLGDLVYAMLFWRYLIASAPALAD